jgi:hypothetical protein
MPLSKDTIFCDNTVMNRPYEQIPEYPPAYDGVGVLVRMIDGLGFRLRWATEGLGDEDWAFRPSAGTMSIAELVSHIRDLIEMVGDALGLMPNEERGDGDPLEQSLEFLMRLRRVLLDDPPDLDAQPIKEFPFWHAINGPLADALTHVGQINSFRRLAGHPAPRVNVFRGR